MRLEGARPTKRIGDVVSSSEVTVTLLCSPKGAPWRRVGPAKSGVRRVPRAVEREGEESSGGRCMAIMSNWSSARLGALAGSAGGLAAVLASLILQPLVGLPTLPDLLQDRLVQLTPGALDRKSTRLNSSHYSRSRMPSSA